MEDLGLLVECPHCKTQYKSSENDHDKFHKCSRCNRIIPLHPVSSFLNGSGTTPYRDLVAKYFKTQSVHRLQNEVDHEQELLPGHLRPMVDGFIQSLSTRFIRNRQFWEEATCEDAFHSIMETSMETLPIEDRFQEKEDIFRKENQTLAYQLFRIANLSFACAAALGRKQQKLMGIQRSIFNA